MAVKKRGQTFVYSNPPHIVAHASIVGPEESRGPYGEYFDLHCSDTKCGKDSWEKGEEQMAADAVNLSMDKASVSAADVDFLLGGDLLNQIITSDFVARDQDIPFLGLYSACATLVEGLLLGAGLMDGGFADCVVAFASSHYQTAERQYRTPLEYGVQYPPYKQFTVTAAGSYVLGWTGGGVWITHGTLGKVMDLGVSDPNDLGSAMAPAAAELILQHFSDLKRGIVDYDLILTGDLGKSGIKMLTVLLEEKGILLSDKLMDCGAEIFGGEKKYGAGGSGVGASAAFVGSVIIPRLISGELERVLLVGTGALLSTITVKQSETIPGISHGVVIEKLPGG
ncbi:MAG: stage V sporulation protein AD [Halanaerobiaceae bacterium]|nr:stage V sporulation protein AD [Halanaerobiaceae bacterium]